MTSVDLAIVGSGFGGSLLARIASRLGLSVVLLERGAHPRVALGESTTPLANLVLADLARRYGLRSLFERSCWGLWREARPTLPVGLKRGFTFLGHREGAPLDPAARLLVAASDRDAVADVQWLRADFDQWMLGEAVAEGVTYLDRAQVVLESEGDPVRLRVSRGSDRFAVEANLLVDATGEGGFLASALGIPPSATALSTWTLWTHLLDVPRLAPFLSARGFDVARFPYAPDDAALHHIHGTGWMWHLRFEDGRTSVGMVFDAARDPMRAETPEAEWEAQLARFPALRDLYGGCRRLLPVERKPVLTRMRERAAGGSWLMLPHAACFADPLLSGGIPHTLLAIERLAGLLENGIDAARGAPLRALGERTLREARHLFDIVEGCYRSFARFDLFSAFVMHYFVAATSLEQARRARSGEDPGFLRADDPAFRAVIAASRADLEATLAAGGDGAAFLSRVGTRLAPWNREGFADPGADGLYRSPVRAAEIWSPATRP